MSDTNKPCACGSCVAYVQCCGRYHSGAENASTAEALMRSRYCAFVEGAIDYLVATTWPAVRRTDLWIDYQSSHKTIDWIGLEVVSTWKGGPGDKTGKVEFRAIYVQNQRKAVHHERSRFRRHCGAWCYVDGIITDTALAT